MGFEHLSISAGTPSSATTIAWCHLPRCLPVQLPIVCAAPWSPIPLLSPPAAAVRTGSSRRGRIYPQRATLAALLAVYMAGVLPQPADAAFECRIKKSITSGSHFDMGDNHHFLGESYPAHIYATVASTGCTADATALSSRAATAAALRCSTQTNLPASTNSGFSSTISRSIEFTGAITPSVAMSFATLGANLVDGECNRALSIAMLARVGWPAFAGVA